MVDFIIIGAQRCGTTSLYNYICQHSFCTRALVKEVHFFDKRYHFGRLWYKLFFPGKIFGAILRRIYGKELITGESSPYYLFHPLVP